MSERASFLFGCHHKTGTVWLRRFAQSIATTTGRNFIETSDLDATQKRAVLARATSSDLPLLVFDHHSKVPPVDEPARWRGLHLIRDPRDLALSAANYHGWSEEAWLRVPLGELGGASYQATIRPLDLAQAVEFELTHESANTIRDMLAFEDNRIFLTVSYEALIVDLEPTTLTAIADHLGIARSLVVRACAHARGSRAARIWRQRAHVGTHVQDGSPRQWVWLYDAAMLENFERHFPGAADRLGYERSREDALKPDVARRLRYESRYWANRGNWPRAIANATALLALAGDANVQAWLTFLERMAGTDM